MINSLTSWNVSDKRFGLLHSLLCRDFYIFAPKVRKCNNLFLETSWFSIKKRFFSFQFLRCFHHSSIANRPYTIHEASNDAMREYVDRKGNDTCEWKAHSQISLLLHQSGAFTSWIHEHWLVWIWFLCVSVPGALSLCETCEQKTTTTKSKITKDSSMLIDDINIGMIQFQAKRGGNRLWWYKRRNEFSTASVILRFTLLTLLTSFDNYNIIGINECFPFRKNSMKIWIGIFTSFWNQET